MTSQYIFNDGEMKSRLTRTSRLDGEDWFIAEWKPNDPDMIARLAHMFPDGQWLWWIAGTREWLGLTDQEVEWSIDKRKKKK
jgi:hypothetical protein